MQSRLETDSAGRRTFHSKMVEFDGEVNGKRANSGENLSEERLQFPHPLSSQNEKIESTSHQIEVTKVYFFLIFEKKDIFINHTK